jgi:hypothetical protein
MSRLASSFLTIPSRLERAGLLVDATLSPNNGAHLPATGEVGSPSADVAVRVSPPLPIKKRIDGAEVTVSGMSEAVYTTVATEPKNGMYLTVDSVAYLIDGVEVIRSGTAVACYVLTLNDGTGS